MWRQLRHFIEKNERHLSSAALVIGFIIDNLTFSRVDLFLDNLILISYLAIAALAITVRNLYEQEVLRGKFFGWTYVWAPIVLQLVFGGLFSGFVVLYSRSASFIASWPFLLILAGLLIGNEFFRARYMQLTFQVSMLFVGIFAFMIFAVPVALRTMGDGVFLLSGALSLAVIALFLRFLRWTIPGRIRASNHALAASVVGIFVGIALLYFANIIPPIPLALKDAGAVHSLARSGGGYALTIEEQPWLTSLLFSPTIHIRPNDPVYMYSAIFAPTQLNVQIFHRWQYIDTATNAWITSSRVSFAITGGRDGGYRGYSVKYRVFPGKWRVNIETARGQLIGRETFYVEYVSQLPLLRQEIR